MLLTVATIPLSVWSTSRAWSIQGWKWVLQKSTFLFSKVLPAARSPPGLIHLLHLEGSLPMPRPSIVPSLNQGKYPYVNAERLPGHHLTNMSPAAYYVTYYLLLVIPFQKHCFSSFSLKFFSPEFWLSHSLGQVNEFL